MKGMRYVFIFKIIDSQNGRQMRTAGVAHSGAPPTHSIPCLGNTSFFTHMFNMWSKNCVTAMLASSSKSEEFIEPRQ